MHITLDYAKNLMNQIASEQPEKVAFCNYVQDNSPECIVGVFLHRSGVSIDDLSIISGQFGGGVMSNRTKLADLTFDSKAIRYIDAVQSYQDGRYASSKQSWINAVQRANDLFKG